MLTKMKIALVIAGSLVTGVAAAQGPQPTMKHQRKAEMLQKYDANRDGSLDDKERTAMHEERTLVRFKKLDTDGNGVLSLAEFKAGKQHMKGKRHHARFGKRGMRGPITQ